MTHEPRPGSSIDPDMLAAYIDNTLPPGERASVEAQLAADPDSYAVLVATLKALPDAPEVHALPEPAAGGGLSRWYWIGGALAAAAAVVLAVRLQPQPAPGDAAFQKLVAAAGAERYVEGRVTGGFAFGPMRPATRRPQDTSGSNLQLVAAAAELREAAERDPSAPNLAAWGVAQLLLREYDGAVKALQEASGKGASAEIDTNRAAALLARATTTGSTADLQAALDAADSALRRNQTLPEARYNRALILERMGRSDEALSAWQGYLSVDAAGPWADDARAHTSPRPASR
jgi:tetratricopeptide (TPR) repeat protein